LKIFIDKEQNSGVMEGACGGKVGAKKVPHNIT
jgi:hypothetical protein